MTIYRRCPTDTRRRRVFWSHLIRWHKSKDGDDSADAGAIVDNEVDRMLQAYACEAVAADRAKRAVPEGWQLVPKIPTLEMIDAMAKAWQEAAVDEECVAEYYAMLAAAPLPKEHT